MSQVIIADNNEVLHTLSLFPPPGTMTTPTNYSTMDVYEVEVREMDTLKVKVMLRYMRMQLYNGAFNFVWKKYNDHNITSAWKWEMYESFKENGVLVVKTDVMISTTMDETLIEMAGENKPSEPYVGVGDHWDPILGLKSM
jgi:hypothetical protein